MTSNPQISDKAVQILADLQQIESSLDRIRRWAQEMYDAMKENDESGAQPVQKKVED